MVKYECVRAQNATMSHENLNDQRAFLIVAREKILFVCQWPAHVQRPGNVALPVRLLTGVMYEVNIKRLEIII